MSRPFVTQRVYLCAPAAFRARRVGGGDQKILIAAPSDWARRRRLPERRQANPMGALPLASWQHALAVDTSAWLPAMKRYARTHPAPIMAGIGVAAAGVIAIALGTYAPQESTVAPVEASLAHAEAAPAMPAPVVMPLDPFAGVTGSAFFHAPARAGRAARRSKPSPSTLGLADDGTIVVVAEPRKGAAAGFNLDITSPASLWAKMGARYRIDPVLIYAVALVETRGLQPDGSVAPSPWVVRINGHLHSGTRAETEHAIELANLLAVPVQDVGIMQVYYPMHRDIEPDPIALLNPAHNIDIGTRLLRQAMRESSDPVLRIGYYHSHDATLARGYGQLVLNVYRELKQAMGKSPAQAVALEAAVSGANRPGG